MILEAGDLDFGGQEDATIDLGASWTPLGASWRRLGPSWRRLGPSWRRLGPSWRRLGGILEASSSHDGAKTAPRAPNATPADKLDCQDPLGYTGFGGDALVSLKAKYWPEIDILDFEHACCTL